MPILHLQHSPNPHLWQYCLVERVSVACKHTHPYPEPRAQANYWWLLHNTNKCTQGRIIGPTDQPIPRLSEDESSHPHIKTDAKPPHRDMPTILCTPPGSRCLVGPPQDPISPRLPIQKPHPPTQRQTGQVRRICRINSAVENRDTHKAGNRKNRHPSGDPMALH